MRWNGLLGGRCVSCLQIRAPKDDEPLAILVFIQYSYYLAGVLTAYAKDNPDAKIKQVREFIFDHVREKLEEHHAETKSVLTNFASVQERVFEFAFELTSVPFPRYEEDSPLVFAVFIISSVMIHGHSS